MHRVSVIIRQFHIVSPRLLSRFDLVEHLPLKWFLIFLECIPQATSDWRHFFSSFDDVGFRTPFSFLEWPNWFLSERFEDDLLGFNVGWEMRNSESSQICLSAKFECLKHTRESSKHWFVFGCPAFGRFESWWAEKTLWILRWSNGSHSHHCESYFSIFWL